MGPPVTCVLSSPNASGAAHGLLSEPLHDLSVVSLAWVGELPELASAVVHGPQQCQTGLQPSSRHDSLAYTNDQASHAAISPWACTMRTRASAAACASQTPCSACPHTARRTAHRLPCPDARMPGASSGGSGRTALNASTAALFFLTHSPPAQSRSALWSGQMLARRNIRSELSLGASHAAGGGTGGTHSCAVLVIPASRRQPQPLRQNSKHMPSRGCR